MNFTKWSNLNPEARTSLKPNLGVKAWDEIGLEKRQLIWKHFENKNWFLEDGFTYTAVSAFDNEHKAGDYCRHLLGHGGPHYYDTRGYYNMRDSCCNGPAQMDMKNIFLRQNQDVTYELISYYAQVLKTERPDDKYQEFTSCFNDISEQFGLNIMLGENGLILRQDKKIDTEIYEPVLNYLSDKKWEPVNLDLKDAFSDYLKSSPEGYSSCITHATSALQAFLQITVNGTIGKGDISELTKDAQKRGLLPNDSFSNKIFKDIVSVIMIERQSKGDPHPKQEYANQKTARLVLNLIMIFMQHAIQK